MTPPETREQALRERLEYAYGRASKSPSHIEEFRSAVLEAAQALVDGFVPTPEDLLDAVERYDAAKGGARG